MRRFFVAVCCGAILVVPCGCMATKNSPSLAALQRVPTDVKGELTDTFHRTKETVARTWLDVCHDWNYTEDDGFAEIRTAAGH